MSTADFLRYIEEYHHEDGPGVPRDLVETYAERLADQRRVSFDADSIMGSLNKRLTDDETWTKNALYAVGSDRVSTCPLRWHEELEGATDLSEFVAVMQKGVDLPDQVPGVRREQVLNAATVLSKMDRDTASDRLQTQRREGDITSEAAQGEDLNLQDRNANLYVPDEDVRQPTETSEDVADEDNRTDATASDESREENAETAADASESDPGSDSDVSTESEDETTDVEDEPATMPDEESEPSTTPHVDEDQDASTDSTRDDERSA